MSESSSSSASPAVAVDPFTQVYDRLWALLLAYSPFATAVLPGNRIKLSAGTPVIKDQARDADLPEAMLHQTRFTFDAFATSTSTSFMQSYRLALTHDNLRIDLCNSLKWHAITALSKADPHLSVLPSDIFADPDVGRFVDKWTITDGMNQVTDTAGLDGSLNRGRQRWVSLLDINVQMRWPLGALRAA